MKYQVNNIIWFCDNSEEAKSLPTSVEVEIDNPFNIADKLSDDYGFLVNSFNYE